MMPGRPKEYRSRTTISVSLEQELLEAFKRVAVREGKPVNRLIQEFMRDYVKKHGSGNPAFPLDKWVDNPELSAHPTIGEPLTKRFAKMNDEEVYELAKTLKARAQETAFEMKKRRLDDIHWTWGLP
jgi:hypothetical protein